MDNNEEILSKINIKTKKIYQEQLKNLELNIHNILEKAILSVLGLEKQGFNRFEFSIDHCNNRNSVLIDKIRDVGKDLAAKIISEISLSEEELTEIKEACKKDLKYNIRDLLRKELSDVKERLIKNIVMEHEEEIKKDIKRQIGLIEHVVRNKNETT